MIDEKQLQETVELVEKDNQFQEITTAEEWDKAGAYLKSVKKLYKDLEAKRLSMTRPLDDSKKKIMAMFKPTLGKLLAVEAAVVRVISDYQDRVRRQQAEELAKREAEEKKLREEQEKKAQVLADAGLADMAEAVQAAEVEMPEAVEPIRSKPAGITERTYWKFRVLNIEMIPTEYLMVDTVKINKVVSAMKEKTTIPGIEVYSKKSMY